MDDRSDAQRAYDEDPTFRAMIDAALASPQERRPRRQPRPATLADARGVLEGAGLGTAIVPDGPDEEGSAGQPAYV